MPLERTDASQVVTWTPQMTNPRWLGALGHVNQLVYSFSCPGGPDQLTCNLMVEANFRTDAMNVGRIVQVYRGGIVIWEGILQEPVPTAQGWNIAAAGAGNYGANFVAYYTSTWPASEPDQSLNDAISRGLRWVNPGQDGVSGLWTGQEVDPGAQMITDLLNLVTTNGALTWYVTTTPYGNYLAVFALPTTPNRVIVASTPVARSLSAQVNTIYLRYQATADNTTTGASATYATTSVSNAASIAQYGEIETYADLSDAGVMTAGAAQALGQNVLNRFMHASFAGPFVCGPGQLLTTGGSPIDLGMDQAGTVAKLILTDYGYGGEVGINTPVNFLIGAYSYDDDAQTATISPFNYLATDLSSLLNAVVSMLPQPSDPST